jgi:tagatose-6-phosphate ketose/aldose isomerase
VLLMPATANDRGFAMTSSFTSMLLAAWLVLSPAGDRADLAERLAAAAEQVLAESDILTGLAARGYDRVVYLSNDAYTRRYDEDIAEELRAAIGSDNVLVVAGRDGDSSADTNAWRIGGLHDLNDAALALPLAVIAQVLALQFSLELGRTPDNPFPDGEVNRVVQGVTIHPLPA